MSRFPLVIVPQFDAVEIVFFPQETFYGARNQGLEAWLCCRPCETGRLTLTTAGHFQCMTCGCDATKAEIAALVTSYKQELDKIEALVMPPKKPSFWKRLFGRNNE